MNTLKFYIATICLFGIASAAVLNDHNEEVIGDGPNAPISIGPFFNPSTGEIKSYWIYDETYTWAIARHRCIELNQAPLAVTSTLEHNWLVNHQQLPSSTYFWTSGRQLISYVWDTLPETPANPDWASYPAVPTCIAMYKTIGLYLQTCTSNFRLICQSKKQ